MVRSFLLWCSAFAAGLLAGPSCANEQECRPGYEGCVCVEEGCAEERLVCLSGHCVDPNWTPPDSEGSIDGGDVGHAGNVDSSGGGSPDNVAACNALFDEIGECGDFDLSEFIDCSAYADQPCDVTAYFDCIRDAFMCVDGLPDTTGFLECTDLATCP